MQQLYKYPGTNTESKAPFSGINPHWRCRTSISANSAIHLNCFLYKLKVSSNKFTSLNELTQRVFPFSLKICIDNVNEHYSGNLSSNKICFNMTLKFFRQVFQPSKFSKQPQMAYLLSYIFFLIFNISQYFHIFLPYVLSIIHIEPYQNILVFKIGCLNIIMLLPCLLFYNSK